MTSETDFLGEEIPLETLDSEFSEVEMVYDDGSYGSDVQPPNLTEDFVRVHEECCRARYHPSRTGKDAPYSICVNKSTCQSLAGGSHPVLREEHWASTGIYEGIYGPSGKILAAKAGTRVTPETVERLATESCVSDRAQAEAINGLTPDTATEEGGLLSRFSIS